MTHLGEFGNPHPEHNATFSYFGATIRVHPQLTDIALMELGDVLAALGQNDESPLEALRRMTGVLVHPNDVDVFWARLRANRQTTEDLSDLAVKLVEGITDRPTGLPSDSSAGQPNTPTSSEAASSSVDEEALRLLEGRPRLQVLLLPEHHAA